MVIERENFETTRTEEERATDRYRVLSLRLSREEDEALQADMRTLDIGVDSAAIKLLVEIGRKVLHDQVGDEALKYLVSRKRTRFDGRKR